MDKQTIINNCKICYQIDYRDIQYPRLEFRTGELLLVLPKNHPNPEHLLETHNQWINEKSTQIQKALQQSTKKKLNTSRTIQSFKKKTKSVINNYQQSLNIEINSIRYRKMKSKWASCSNKGNITINTLLKYLPPKNIRYVIYHELVHLKEKKHNQLFWNIVKREFPDYKKMENELFTYWFLIQKNMGELDENKIFKQP
jgi:predicted metal-dependent hydrolase